jgi:membrane protease YdiL (CAAX protease family)
VEAFAGTEPPSIRYHRLTGTLHTAVLIVILAAWAGWARLSADRMGTAANHHVLLYVPTLLFEWLLFGFVVWGLRRAGVPLHTVFGARWRSARQVLRDAGIAAAFWIVSIALLATMAYFMHAQTGAYVKSMLPRGGVEIGVWVVLSVSAGICEEAVFRGYLQRQCTALTQSVPAGILLSAVVFGAGHVYQGFRSALLIAAYGLMFGILAHWRGNLRPGMMAHAWHDGFTGIAASLVPQ